jgi:hypothetical protein
MFTPVHAHAYAYTHVHPYLLGYSAKHWAGDTHVHLCSEETHTIKLSMFRNWGLGNQNDQRSLSKWVELRLNSGLPGSLACSLKLGKGQLSPPYSPVKRSAKSLNRLLQHCHTGVELSSRYPTLYPRTSPRPSKEEELGQDCWLTIEGLKVRV